jgi:hypothetical protein
VAAVPSGLSLTPLTIIIIIIKSVDNFYMHWETKIICATRFMTVIWNRACNISGVCLYCISNLIKYLPKYSFNILNFSMESQYTSSALRTRRRHRQLVT